MAEANTIVRMNRPAFLSVEDAAGMLTDQDKELIRSTATGGLSTNGVIAFVARMLGVGEPMARAVIEQVKER
jgi:hypothetical protein